MCKIAIISEVIETVQNNAYPNFITKYTLDYSKTNDAGMDDNKSDEVYN